MLLITMPFMGNQLDPDLWHRLATGELVVNSGSMPDQDLFAYTPRRAQWIDHEWGSGVVFFLANQSGGPNALALLKFLSLAGVIAIILRTAHGESRHQLGATDLIPVFLVLWGLLPGFTSVIRCQVFTFIFFAFWIGLLRSSPRGNERRLLLIPLSMVAWANLHGGFLAGVGLLMIEITGRILDGRKPWKLFFITAITGLVTLLNPYGIKLWIYLIDAVMMPRPFIDEWESVGVLSPDPRTIGLRLFLLFGILVLAMRRLPAPWRGKSTLHWPEALLMAVTCFLALRHAKHGPLFVIAAAPFIIVEFRNLIDDLRRRMDPATSPGVMRQTRAAIFSFFVALSIFMMPRISWTPHASEPNSPVRAIAYIRESGLRGNLLIPFDWGSYALWYLRDRCQVAIDGRYEETYTDETYLKVARFFYRLPGWQAALTDFANDLVLVPRASPVLDEMIRRKDWTMTYEDSTAVLFKRSQSKGE